MSGLNETLRLFRRIDQKLDTVLSTLQELQMSTSASAAAAGATPAQLAAFDALGAQITASYGPLAAAVTANTPAATS
jgi:hypothetical protein